LTHVGEVESNVQAVGLLSDIQIVPLRRISMKARASFGYAQLQRIRDTDIFETLLHRLPPGRPEEDYKDAVVFDVDGDSMEPSLRDGQQVIAWEILNGKWEYLHNTICVVAYQEEVTVKAILKNDLNHTDGLTLHATGGRGGEFIVERKDINSIWEVREFYGIVPVRLLP
jgi:phage repressor protein C with HTH and peptisase S24 domain